MQENKNPTKDLTLYSQRSIGITTFIGGPLAAAYLIRANYLQLNEPDKGKQVLIYGVIVTFILLGGIFLIPENIIDKIPGFIIPAVYTGFILLYLERIQGTLLAQHKNLGNAFQSGWKAAGIGFISLLIISIAIIAFIFLSPSGKASITYDENIALFSENEEQTLSFYDHIESKNDKQLLDELNLSIIPKWQENIKVLEENNDLENLPEDLKIENGLLLKYSKLRLEIFETFKKGYEGNMENHEARLNMIHIEIDFVLKKINQ